MLMHQLLLEESNMLSCLILGIFVLHYLCFCHFIANTMVILLLKKELLIELDNDVTNLTVVILQS